MKSLGWGCNQQDGIPKRETHTRELHAQQTGYVHSKKTAL